ncbi:MAG TPA: VacJ family lipoprotein [Burkholderiaceae bacterium]|nr:VacJ family lipoprotein [Burkholderiaceae bacterium]
MAKHLGAAALLCLLAGCASVPPNAGSNPVDPFERVNRQIFAFNDGFDRALAKPAAKGYIAVVPKPLRECIGNFFDNLFEITNMINAALQGKGKSAGTAVGRFLINSTVGMAGCIDVASRAGLERDKQFFALTMGTWGIPSGPYLVLPIIGPSSVRDAIGEVPDYFTDPISYIHPVKDYYFVYAGRFVVRRAQILDATNLIEQAALDPYQFVRDAYLQRIRSKIMGDGAPPPPVEEDPDSPAPASPAPGEPAAPAPAPSAAPLPRQEPAAGETAH